MKKKYESLVDIMKPRQIAFNLWTAYRMNQISFEEYKEACKQLGIADTAFENEQGIEL